MLINTSKFFKETKLHEPVGQVQFLVFENNYKYSLYQTAREIMLMLVNDV